MNYTKESTIVKHITDYDQWVTWSYKDKRKVPINPHTHRAAKPTDPATWSSYKHASRVAQLGEHSGLGFVFSSRDPFTGVDIDDCIDPESGEITAHATEIVERLDSYTEVSPSGTGLKIWVRGEKPGGKCRTGNVEMYDRDRFFTFTGMVIRNVPIADRQHELDQLYAELFPATTSHPQPTSANPVGEDGELLRIARNERGGEFKRLYDHGDTSKYGSASSADYRLCVKLVFYFGDDPERIERLFNDSAFGQREKWKTRGDYRHRTITAAIAATQARYNPTPKPRNDVDELKAYASSAQWAGRGGPVDRAVYEHILDTVVVYGHRTGEGYTVCLSVRDVATAAGCGVASASRSIERLKIAGLIEQSKDADGSNAATYIVRSSVPLEMRTGVPLKMRKPEHITSTTPVFNMFHLAQFLRNSGSSRKETVSAKEPGRKVSIVIDSPYAERCVGKLAGQVLVKLVEMGGDSIALKDLAKALGKRSNDLRRRQIPALIEVGLITCGEDGLVSVPENVEDRLQHHLTQSGCYEMERLQRERHDRQREAYRTRNQRPADHAPTEEEMEAERKIRDVYANRDGSIQELEKHNEVFDTFESISNEQQPITLQKNYPKITNGVHEHGFECACWFCGDDEPEYVTTAGALIAA